MKPSTLEWVDKAEGDFVIAQMAWRARKAPNYDAACFHTQQCAEKYLKARLEEAGLPIAKTHNLVALLNQILPIEPSWNVLSMDLNILNAYSVAYRYPGISATKADAQDAIKRCRIVRKVIRLTFGLSV
ncbi:MAG: HEPN domain-containing protein [Acidobacteria bacterium]|nr:HEPN domain-containing protein [Acidobacteriota bacterium]